MKVNILLTCTLIILLVLCTLSYCAFISGSDFHVKGRYERENHKVLFDFFVSLEVSSFNVKTNSLTFSLLLEDRANQYNVKLLNQQRKVIDKQILFIEKKDMDLHVNAVTFNNLNERNNLTLLIEKRTEAYVSGVVTFHGIEVNDMEISYIPTPYIKTEGQAEGRNPIKMEFLGASVSCGYGVYRNTSSGNYDCNTFSEDVNMAFTSLTAKKLGAEEHTVLCWSGVGLLTSYRFQDIYERTFATQLPPNERKWDFTRYTPDVVVINLGNNDWNSKDIPTFEEFERAYNQLVDFVLSKYLPVNKTLKIVALGGVLPKDNWKGATEIVVRKRKDFGKKVFWIDLIGTGFGKEQSDYGCYGHPNDEIHEKMAERLSEFIKTL